MLNIAALRQQQIPLAAEPRSPVPFHILMKPIGPACNLACRYCYYPQDETPVNKMDEARLEQFIRRYIAAQPVGAREINFVWQGGEPLLAGLSFYKKALALQARYAPDGVTISNSLQTNGTLINDAWCRLFREHRFIIGLSLEGSEALQDQHRPDKRGRAAGRRHCAASAFSTSIRWILTCWWWCITRWRPTRRRFMTGWSASARAIYSFSR